MLRPQLLFHPATPRQLDPDPTVLAAGGAVGRDHTAAEAAMLAAAGGRLHAHQ